MMELISGLLLYFACVVLTFAMARAGSNSLLGRLIANDTVAAVLAATLSCTFIIALLMVFFYADQWTHSGLADGMVITALIAVSIVGAVLSQRSRKVTAA